MSLTLTGCKGTKDKGVYDISIEEYTTYVDYLGELGVKNPQNYDQIMIFDRYGCESCRENIEAALKMINLNDNILVVEISDKEDNTIPSDRYIFDTERLFFRYNLFAHRASILLPSSKGIILIDEFLKDE